jgi:hypothetical protein
MSDEIPFTKLVKGNRYTISLRDPQAERTNTELPYEGVFVRQDYTTKWLLFKDVITRYGDKAPPGQELHDPMISVFTDPAARRVAGPGHRAARALRPKEAGTRKHKRRVRKTRRSLK